MNDPGVPSPYAVPPAALPPALPLSFGQMLDRIFRLMRANLKPFIGIASLPAGTMLVLYGVMMAGMLLTLQPWQHPNAAMTPMRALWLVAACAVFFVLFILIFAIYVPAAVDAALQADAGEKVASRQAYAKAWSRAGRYIWLMILFYVIVAGPVLVVAGGLAGGVVLTFAHGNHSGAGPLMMIPLMVVVYLAAMIYEVLMALWLSLAFPACIAEDLTAWGAIRRSVRLTRGAKGRMFLLLLVIYAAVYAGALVVEIALGIVGCLVALIGVALHLSLNPWGFIGIGVAAICVLVALFLVTACTWSAFATTFAVVYHDQRRRMEGIVPAPALAR
jgi:hypothetical protein